PPKPSGTSNDVCHEPSAAALPFPIGTEAIVQHVPVQLTRLPTTVPSASSTGWLGARPATETATLRPTAPDVDSSLTLAPLVASRPVADMVVRVSTVGFTFHGQSVRGGGGTARLL